MRQADCVAPSQQDNKDLLFDNVENVYPSLKRQTALVASVKSQRSGTEHQRVRDNDHSTTRCNRIFNAGFLFPL